LIAHTRSLVAFAHVANVERTIAFYSDLGFTVANSVAPKDGDAPTWAWLESDRAELMIALASEPIDAAQQAVLFYLYFDDIQRTHAVLTQLGHSPGEIQYPFYMPQGEFRLLDPDGYVLILAQI
jgi:catechol 2,3-dioxygenase-like lactoylglutathione lyase family enzyme